MGSAGPGDGRDRRTLVALLLILVAGFALRWWYLDFQLAGSRYWDERFSFVNVGWLLETGTLEPANGYYPLLSYLPHAGVLGAAEALHHATGADWLKIREGAQFTATGYLLARLVQAVLGVGAVWLTFLVGRRLFSAGAALLAATAMAFSPWPVHASGVFKPDTPLLLTVLLAFLWALAADRRPTARRYALAGAGVALAMSTKLTGGLAALPLVSLSLLRCRREPRRLALLALAGAVALVLFLLLNPYWPLYFEFLGKLTTEYELKADQLQMSRWQAPALIGGFLLRCLGPLGSAAAALAAPLLVWLLARGRIDPARTAATATLLLFPPVYAAAYVAMTPQFKPNNFLPIVPFVALAAAWGLVAALGWLGRRLPPARRPFLQGLAGGLIVASFAAPGIVYVHRSLTPEAEDLALRYMTRRLNSHPNCQIVLEPGPERWPPWELARPFRTCALRRVERLTDLEPRELRLVDGIVFPRHRLAGENAAAYLAAVASGDAELTALYPGRGLEVRGPDFVAVVLPWSPRETARPLSPRLRQHGRFRLHAEMPAEVEAGEVVSFTFWLPLGALAPELPAPRMRMGSYIVDLIPLGLGERGALFISPRLVDRQPAPHVRLNRERLEWPEGEVQITLWRWQRDAERP